MKETAFVDQLQNDQIVEAIRKAENKTSGEIRVFISRKSIDDPLAEGREEFNRMGMANTAERNGVLIYVAPRSQNFAILGDQGINERCGESFWAGVAEEMTVHFRKAEFTEGIVRAIQKAGTLLAEHFPCRTDNKNELPDAVERD